MALGEGILMCSLNLGLSPRLELRTLGPFSAQTRSAKQARGTPVALTACSRLPGMTVEEGFPPGTVMGRRRRVARPVPWVVSGFGLPRWSRAGRRRRMQPVEMATS